MAEEEEEEEEEMVREGEKGWRDGEEVVDIAQKGSEGIASCGLVEVEGMKMNVLEKVIWMRTNSK